MMLGLDTFSNDEQPDFPNEVKKREWWNQPN